MVVMEEMLDLKFSQVFGERTDGEEVQEERSQDWKSRGLAYLLSLIKQLPRGSRNWKRGTDRQNYNPQYHERNDSGASFGSAAKQTGLKALEFALSICDTVDMYGFTMDQEWTRYFSRVSTRPYPIAV
ncbi:hypothetical protein L6452_01648 [Arctium lappa]|uniref:Uncharacterized protein n=1 Tax=Arctium lappa TaxID=4217 RepID=A0ACB9FHG5_ARCLA|nr:hypothetical protein L6452_01648 [Arctium lappa]